MYIHAFDSNNVQISEGTGLAPLVVGPLNASLGEVSAAIAVTIKTDAGFSTYGSTTVSFVGTTAAKWTICDTAAGTYGSTLTIPTLITETGTVIYVKAATSEEEAPANDSSVDLKIEAVVAAV